MAGSSTNGKIVKEWVDKAEQDCLAARVLMRQRRLAVYDVICFHSQQCVEKYLKAFLTLQGVPFPKSHDLVVLRNLASQHDGSFELVRDLIKQIDEYAVRFRYPGEEADRKEAKRAISVMEELRRFVRGKICPSG